jgi:hypothetical protein
MFERVDEHQDGKQKSMNWGYKTANEMGGKYSLMLR